MARQREGIHQRVQGPAESGTPCNSPVPLRHALKFPAASIKSLTYRTFSRQMTALYRKDQARFFRNVKLEHLNVFTEKLKRQIDRRVATLSASFEEEGNPDELTGRKADRRG